MDLSILALLAQDGLVMGSVYALLALATVLVFTVTRVIFVPQGEFVAFAGLTVACSPLSLVRVFFLSRFRVLSLRRRADHRPGAEDPPSRR